SHHHGERPPQTSNLVSNTHIAQKKYQKMHLPTLLTTAALTALTTSTPLFTRQSPADVPPRVSTPYFTLIANVSSPPGTPPPPHTPHRRPLDSPHNLHPPLHPPLPRRRPSARQHPLLHPHRQRVLPAGHRTPRQIPPLGPAIHALRRRSA